MLKCLSAQQLELKGKKSNWSAILTTAIILAQFFFYYLHQLAWKLLFIKIRYYEKDLNHRSHFRNIIGVQAK